LAVVNTNTNTDSIVSADIYDLATYYENIRRANMPDVDDDTASVSIFGMLNEMFTQSMQNSIIMNAESTNETIPTRAKFTKNVITHALNTGITNINAIPAMMRMMIYLPIEQLLNNMTETNSVSGSGKFILDKNVPFKIEDFEFHLDYDVIITRTKSSSGVYIYSAMYDLFEDGTTNIKQANPISNITNPYIDAVIQTKIAGVDFVSFAATLHQVKYKSINKNIVTNNTIDNKTLTFTHEGQMASFNIAVIENNKTTYLTPVFNGLLDYSVEDGTWCYYDYVSENMIRVLFSRDSYVPKQGATVIVNLYESEGSNGNFTYTEQFRTSLKSDRFNNYNGMYAYVYPLNGGKSSGGVDKKSITELKKIIPRENTSRKAIINMTDLENFFNSTSISNCKLHFKKKRDNPFERMYYTYMIMQSNGNVYPTNTLNIKVNKSSLGATSENNFTIPPGTIFYYYDHGNEIVKSDSEVGYASTEPPIYTETSNSTEYKMTINSDGRPVRVFEYTNPFLIAVDEDLLLSYLMTVMDKNKTLLFDSINTLSELQFITTNIHWYRNFYTNNGDTYDNKYTMEFDITQNNTNEYGLIRVNTNDDGDIFFEDVRMKVYVVFYTDSNGTIPYRYTEAEIYNYDATRHIMSYKIELTTDDMLDLKNRIKIQGLRNCKPESFQTIDEIDDAYGYMANNTYCKIFILADFGTKPGDTVIDSITGEEVTVTELTQNILIYGTDGIGNRTEIESIIPTKDDIIKKFLENEISCIVDGEEINVISIMKSHSAYMNVVKEYNNDESETSNSILKYLRNNTSSDFVLYTLLQDDDSIMVIDSYNYEDLTRYTLCNTMIVEDGVDFYYDYSSIMHSTVSVSPVRLYDSDGNVLYREVKRYDNSGTLYTELAPAYEANSDGSYKYIYTLDRIPVIKKGYLNDEYLIQDFMNALEERRRYIEECLYILEDTFDIDFKFINTYGPSRTFYYIDPTSKTYDVKVNSKQLYVYSNTAQEAPEYVVGILQYEQVVTIEQVNGQWGYITSPYIGWIKLSDTERINTFIDNVAITMKFSLEASNTAGKLISNNIIQDIKLFIEDINNISELHIPNIITLITNNYREQINWFDFGGINEYGIQCKHLYVYEPDHDSVDIVPEFINVATSSDGQFTPLIDITVN